VWASFNTIYIPSKAAPLVSPELEVIIRLSCDEGRADFLFYIGSIVFKRKFLLKKETSSKSRALP
jgi:hypothetical protein